MEHVERALASLVPRVRWEELPDSAQREAVRAVVDFLAAAIGGYRFGEIRPALCRLIPGSPEGEASLLGSGKRASLLQAALFNATLGHATELDDGVRLGSAHVNTVVVPVALGLGAQLERSGSEVLEAIVAGYEVLVRIAAAINPSNTRRGFHTTGYAGPFGAAAAAARLLRLPEEGVLGALGTAGLMGAGLLETTRSGQLMKPIHAGRAAEGGLLAARLAEAGAGGPTEVLSGPKGLGQAVSDGVKWDRILGGNPRGCWEIVERYIKPYPTCRHIHAAIDLALQLHRERRPTAAEIKSVRVATYFNAVRETGEIARPTNAGAARFSMAYAVASALLRGTVCLEDLEPEALREERVLSLADRVTVSLGPEQDAAYPRERRTEMRIELADGLLTLQTSYPRGEPENPLTDSELEDKLRRCCGRAVGEGLVEELLERVRALPSAAVCPDLLGVRVEV